MSTELHSVVVCTWVVRCCVRLGSLSYKVGHHIRLDFFERQCYLSKTACDAGQVVRRWWASCELSILSMKSRPALSKRPPILMMTGMTLPLYIRCLMLWQVRPAAPGRTLDFFTFQPALAGQTTPTSSSHVCSPSVTFLISVSSNICPAVLN